MENETYRTILMKLQQKTALIFITLLITLMIIVSVFSSIVILSSYADLEQQYAKQELSQVVTKVEDETTVLSALVTDWGPWDDSYNFVRGTKPDFVQINLLPETFDNLRVNVIILTNRDGGIVYAGAYNFSSGMMVPVPEDLVAQLDTKNPLLDLSDPRRATRGIILLSAHPMLIASRPIVRTDFSGEPQGVVIMGRYLDSEEVNHLAQLTRPSLKFTRVDNPALQDSLIHTLKEKTTENGIIIQTLDHDTIAGYAVIRDIYGKDALVLEISNPRNIYHQGLATTLKFIWLFLIGGLVFGLVVMLLLDRLILARLGTLIAQVHDIGRQTVPSGRVSVEGSDEFSDLSAEINRMLGTIEKTHDGLMQSEARLRELADLLPLSIFELDLNNNLSYINKFGMDLFGLTEKDLDAGLNARQLIIPEDIGRMEHNLKKVAAGNKSPGETYTLIKKDKNTMQAMLVSSPIIHGGKFEGFRGYGVDISERIQLEEELEESTELLTGILQASPVGVFRLDPSGRITFANETFTRITGIPFDSIRGTCWADILPQEDRNLVLRELGESHRERRTSRVEIRYIHHDGTPYWLFSQTVPLFDKNDNLNGWAGTITDITEQKKIEDALKESEEKYRALTENTADILFSTDMTGIISYISPQLNIYGFLEEEMLGKPLRILIHPADRDQVESNLSHAMEKGAQFSSRFRILDKWGGTNWFEEKSSLRLDLSGKPAGIYGILRDVTERKRVEDAIEIANKKLNLMNQITRHDILNTLTGLYGCVDMAKATHPPEEIAHLLNDIRDLTRVIQRHITFTREYQEVGVHLPQWQNVNDLLNKVLPSFQKSGITFSVECEKMEIYADPLLEKVFYNLVDNAVRYGQHVTTIKFYYQISDEGLALICEDDGVGITASAKEKIFERGVGQNTGMGLFLTREILMITAIQIRENGIYGRGARFVILMPNGTWRFVRE